MQRISYIAFAVVMMVFASWQASRYFSFSERVDEDESIADLEGFDSAPLFDSKSNEDKKSNEEKPSSAGLGQAVPMLSAPAPDISAQDLNRFLFTNSTSQSDVWLTGTIEEIDSLPTIALPDQLSEKPRETSVFR